MKVLHVINSLEIGGAQRLLSDLIPLQIKHGLEVSVLIGEQKESEFSKKIQNEGCDICLLDTWPSPRDVEECRMPSRA